jgi:hypothetical protein
MGRKGIKYNSMKNSILTVSKINTVPFLLILLLENSKESSWKMKAKDTNEEMMPTSQSSTPMLVNSFAKKVSVTSRETKYSTVHCTVYAFLDF